MDFFSLFKASFSRLNQKKPIQEFEQNFSEYMSCDHTIAFSFARSAVYCALKSQKLEPGSEIIMPPVSIKAMLDVAIELKLRPVFVDIDPDTLCFEISELEKAINPRTSAILITYLFGMVPNMDDLIGVCRKNDLFVVEDFSHCLNARYKGKKLGTFGDVGVYSSSSIKTLDTFGGGLAITNNPTIASKLRSMQEKLKPPSRKLLIKRIFTNIVRNFATNRLVFHFLTYNYIRFSNWRKDGAAMKHMGDRDKQMIDKMPSEWFTGYSSFQAKLGTKLISGVESNDSTRIANVEFIKERAKGANFPKGADETHNVYWQFAVYFDNPVETQKFFHEKRIDTSTTSLVKISNLPAYPVQAFTPNADRLHDNGVLIPSYHRLFPEELEKISSAMNQKVAET